MHPAISAFSGPEFGPQSEPTLTQDTRRRPAPIRYPDFSYTGPNLSGFPHHRPDLTHTVGPGFTWRPAGLLTALVKGSVTHSKNVGVKGSVTNRKTVGVKGSVTHSKNVGDGQNKKRPLQESGLNDEYSHIKRARVEGADIESTTRPLSMKPQAVNQSQAKPWTLGDEMYKSLGRHRKVAVLKDNKEEVSDENAGDKRALREQEIKEKAADGRARALKLFAEMEMAKKEG
jgi:hypothetical protein